MATGILADTASHQTQSQLSQYRLLEADRQAIKALAPCPEGIIERQRQAFVRKTGDDGTTNFLH